MAYFIKLLVLVAAVTTIVVGIPVGIRTRRNDDAFARFDKDGDGFISRKEIEDEGFQWTDIISYDLNNDQKLSSEEFSILLQVAKNGVKETNYLNHFRAADANHDGFVTTKELYERLKALGNRVTQRQVAGTVHSKDQNNDGKFNYYGPLCRSPTEFRNALFNVSAEASKVSSKSHK